MLTNTPLNLRGLNFLQRMQLNIALLGGSFDPAHQGHIDISLQALRHYHFDYIIWIVAKQNPLKVKATKDIFSRSKYAVQILQNHPKILVSTIEHDLNCHYSYDVINYLTSRFSSCKFTWLMGIDAFLGLDKWYKSKKFCQKCDIIVFDRPIFNRLVNIYSLSPTCTLDKTKTNRIMLHKGKLNDISSSFIRYSNNGFK
jgi:nicotinate-nucleotide adenylyltransferase